MNTNQQQPQDIPKIEELDRDRQYQLENNGDVILTETVITKITFTGRQFISFIRQHETGIEELDKQLSDKHKEELLKRKEEIIKFLVPIKDLQTPVETKMKEQYEEQQKNYTIGQIKEILSKPNPKLDYLAAIWSNVPADKKESILVEMTEDEKKKILELKLDKMKAARGKKSNTHD